MASMWSKSTQDTSRPQKDGSDVADTGLADVGLPPPQPLTSVPMGRPQLQRNQPQPPPQHQPPPPPAPQQIGNPNDSLSLMQLRRIVTEFPRTDPTSYAFTYTDTAALEEEIDEWFSYSGAEFKRLRRAKNTFERRWKKYAGKPWLDADDEERRRFVQREINGLLATDLRRRCKSLQTILHIVLGIWDETAGLDLGTTGSKGKEKEEETSGDVKNEQEASKPKSKASKSQLEHMKAAITLITDVEGIASLFQVLQDAFKRLWYAKQLPRRILLRILGTMNFGNPNSLTKIFHSSKMSSTMSRISCT